MHKLARNHFVYLSLCFLGGFLVMLLEMCAFRVLATQFGASIYVTGTLLTLIMSALSLGYFVGGRLSTKTRSPSLLLLTLLLGCCIYISVVDLIFSHSITVAMSSLWDQLEPGSLSREIFPPALAAMILYGIPMFILAQISPFVIQLNCQWVDTKPTVKPGAESGKVMALSTLGSILGTLLTSYFLLPTLGLRDTLGSAIALLAVFLIVTIILLKIKTKLLQTIGLTGLIGFLTFHFFFQITPVESNLIYSAESNYGNMKVYAQTGKDGEKYLIYKPSRNYIHSIFYPTDPLKSQFNLSYLTPALGFGAKSYLLLGTGGGTIIRQIQALDKDKTAQITAVEIDKKVIGLAKTYFGVVPSATVKIINSDAKAFLLSTHQKFDYIMTDLYSGEFVPAHCLTQEFFTLAYNRLNENGILYVNTNMFDFSFSDPVALGVFSPLHHLQATVFRAGFNTLIENNLFHGFYAFKIPVTHSEFVERLSQLFFERNPERILPESIRTALATTILRTAPVPTERATLRPYDSDWTPEHLIQLKTNQRHFDRALFKQMTLPDWHNQESLVIPSPLARISSQQRFQLWKENKNLGKLPFGSVSSCDQYFKDTSDWVQNKGYSSTELGKYFLLSCDFTKKDSEKLSQGERFIYAYNQGIQYANQDYYKQSLPLLSYVLERYQMPGIR